MSTRSSFPRPTRKRPKRKRKKRRTPRSSSRGGRPLRRRLSSSGLLHLRGLEPLRHGVLAIDEDRVVRAGLLALAAARAVLLDHRDDPEEARGVLDRHHLQRLERAALDALLAARARLLVDEGDGPLVLLQHALHVAVLVEDGVDGADGDRK